MNRLRSKSKFHGVLDAKRYNAKISDLSNVPDASGSYSRPNAIDRISTGSKSLDDILCGGIETKALTEFYGEPSFGKTQLCHTLCVTATQDKHGITGKAIYVDTEGKFRPERIASIAASRGFNSDKVLSNILCVRTMTSPQQDFIIDKVQLLIEKDNDIKLLIVDSVTNNYRAEVHKLSDRQKKLYKFMSCLTGIAQKYSIAVVITNQVNFSGRLGTANPSGGSIMAHASTYRIHLRRLYNNRIAAKIVSSPYHTENGTYLMINERGMDDMR
jgi:DNA repair protein RadA